METGEHKHSYEDEYYPQQWRSEEVHCYNPSKGSKVKGIIHTQWTLGAVGLPMLFMTPEKSPFRARRRPICSGVYGVRQNLRRLSV
jgi:hypothetical protein